MDHDLQSFGFSYFSSPNYLVEKQVKTWMASLQRLGASMVILKTGFGKAIPEDVFITAQDHKLVPVVHFKSELPSARTFNDVAVIMDVYAKWGVAHVILGDKPNNRSTWPKAGGHDQDLVDNFLDRFIPIANHAVHNGISPVLPPMQPGGDYWDTVFIELVLKGMKRRQLDGILENLLLSSYGYTFDKSLLWGKGGPERWVVSKPYLTPDGQEDQLGFYNFEWIQAVGQRIMGRKMEVFILDAGHSGTITTAQNKVSTIENAQKLLVSCQKPSGLDKASQGKLITFGDSVKCCTFDLDTLMQAHHGSFSWQTFEMLFDTHQKSEEKITLGKEVQKRFAHYLLLPCHTFGVSDVVLNKVRPIIKRLHPTVGFSLEEASYAKKVSVFPDPILFTDEQINNLRTAGCEVKILPESGMEIATKLQGS